MQEPAMLEPVLARLDRLAASYVPSILRLDSDAVERIINRLLAEIGEALGTSQIVFASTGGSSGSSLMRQWSHPGSGARGEAMTVPVAVAGHRFGALSVGLRPDGTPFPDGVVARLPMLADLMALTVQCGERMTALKRAEADASRVFMTSLPPCEESVDAGEFEDIIGDSRVLRIAIARVLEVAPTDASVVLHGETGTGKELFARAIHNRSRRRGRPFICVNCAALPPTLIEPELFGHERGAFTGAVSMRRGRFELADKGTLFLDEIGDLPVDVQAKLLRVLQAGEFERVGSSESHHVDVRVVAATHHDLDAAVKDGRFRADLYYRLNVFPIALPPLRERREDISRLTWFFVNRRQRALDRKVTCIPPSVLAALEEYAWPGNVRELENVVERALIHSTGNTLELDEGVGAYTSRPSAESSTLEDVERRHIEQVLRRCRWRINGAGNSADVLGLHPNTLRFRMKKLGIQRPKGLVVLDAGRMSA